MSQARPSLVVIGAGPRVAGVLERMAANAPELLRSEVDIHLVDPHEPGSGRVWRHEQYPGLLLNSQAQDITLFTDATVNCEGPRTEGPDLLEWAGTVAPEALEDPQLLTEAAALRLGSFPSRRLFGAYARWFLHAAVLRLAPRARVTVHRDTALSVHDAGEDGHHSEAAHSGASHRVLLASGTVLEAAVVLYALGHSDARPDDRERELAAFAERHGGAYLPASYTADADYSAILPGQDVLVSGLGLAFIDLVVLLFEGRGGRFQAAEGGRLDYVASGREPRLWAGSRRGVPYHAKPQAPLRGPLPAGPRYLNRQAVTSLADLHPDAAFRELLWPLVQKEAAHYFYAELFAASPERVSGPWHAFLRRLDTVTWASAEAERLLADFLPDPADRLDFARLDRPLAGLHGGIEEREDAVRQHIENDLRLRSDPERSEQTALFVGLLQAYVTLGDAAAPFDEWWHGFFSFVDSGPPPHRLQELLALHRAGFVRFLGPGLSVGTDEASGTFTAAVPGSAEVVHASAFVEARLPQPTVRGSSNPALWQLGGSGLGQVRRGRLAVDAQHRILGPDGAARETLFAVGPWTAAWGAAAFARPRTNAAPFRENDALARRLLTLLSRQPAQPVVRVSSALAGVRA
ncbi:MULTISPECIES: FAD/NAD(P)-binding domain-containing protein [Arthrobacter]|uniref:FAD/NAD(P)-binding protein n=2 Tax=Arthrobacter TaxID=1663 RepID=A0ABU9KSY0_9MICC|nr:FAD/NAD(P)-binding domain-containing protein [Arthrobacter sp. YJM1]MDP5228597.1 FAD/NAD(P)-binding protein [Arthrobacter sp. YJM1]